MPKGNFQVPYPENEPVLSYAPGTKERINIEQIYDKMCEEIIEIPQYIGSNKVFSGVKKSIHPPHDHQATVGYWHEGSMKDVELAINTALEARNKWVKLPWEHRAGIFLKAADLIAGPYRAKINAATMIGQSKNVFQAEIDAACEFADFLRFNVQYMTEIYEEQPISSPGIWNRVEYRPLEGFTFAITPFNFTAIAGNLPACMALMGNVVVWKPSDKQIYSAQVIMEIFQEAGVPSGVINMIFTSPSETAKIIFAHPDFSGIHFTGSTFVFKSIWEEIGKNIHIYKNYPRIVGETGGKDFVLAHPSACPNEVAVGLIRGAFEYQGQKCSAASRAYIPKSLWKEVKRVLKTELQSISVGSPRDFGNFVNSVIDKNSFDKIAGYIQRAKDNSECKIIAGGSYDDTTGYFIDPTVIQTSNPHYESMVEEIFGPILTVFVYEDEKWEETLKLIDSTSIYALTGAIFSKDRYALAHATEVLENAAGNFYLNDKPTGAVVGQQPFGGARASGTNDKAGSSQNLLRWVSPRTIKEVFVPSNNYRYPFLQKGAIREVEDQVKEAVVKLKSFGSDIIKKIKE